MKVARRSLITTRDIRVGEIIKESDIAIKRPGTGILPKFKEIIIGMKLINNIRQDEPFRWENFK
jgi:sialic acid synthase SpsE